MRRAVLLLLASAIPLYACSLLLSDPDLVGTANDGGLDDAHSSNDTVEPSTLDAGDAGEAASLCESSDPTLIAWFPFDGDGGDLMRDCSKAARVAIGTIPKPAIGIQGGAIDLFGTDACLDLGEAADAIFDGKPFSVAAWIKPRQYAMPTNEGRWLLGRETTSVNGWHFGTDNPDRAELDMSADGGKVAGSVSIPTEWTHVAATYEPGVQIRVFKDGTLAATQTKSIPPRFGVNSVAHLRIGCSKPTSNTFDGLADDLRLYARLLSDGEIAALAVRPK